MRRIVNRIMDVWHQYRFVRFVRDFPAQNETSYTDLLNVYRAKNSLDERQINELWGEALDNQYVEVQDGVHIRIRAKGKELTEFRFYGLLNTELKQNGRILLFISGVSTLADFGYRVWRHFGH